MKQGAVVREWPHGYSIWNEDATSDDGYTLLKCFVSDPIREVVDELYDVSTQGHSHTLMRSLEL